MGEQTTCKTHQVHLCFLVVFGIEGLEATKRPKALLWDVARCWNSNASLFIFHLSGRGPKASKTSIDGQLLEMHEVAMDHRSLPRCPSPSRCPPYASCEPVWTTLQGIESILGGCCDWNRWRLQTTCRTCRTVYKMWMRILTNTTNNDKTYYNLQTFIYIIWASYSDMRWRISPILDSICTSGTSLTLVTTSEPTWHQRQLSNDDLSDLW